MPLHLLPNLLNPDLDPAFFFPEKLKEVVEKLSGMIAESEKGARQFLKHFKKHVPLVLFNEHSHTRDVDFVLEPLSKGEDWGFVSDAGLPCIADPGSKLVLRAHQRKIPVMAYSGPSSITHALMLSGLPGQHFSFHGYIAKSPPQRLEELKKWENEQGVTHIFIEAPYRNMHTYQSCMENLDERTFLSIAWNLTAPTEGIFTAPISFWRRNEAPPLHKIPAIFLLHRY